MTAPAHLFDPEALRFSSSRNQKRIEDDRLLRGAGLFSDDRFMPGECWVVFLRSPHAHARIAAIDTAAALAIPGVIAVYRCDQLKVAGVQPAGQMAVFKRADGSPSAYPPRLPLADGVARWVGDAVAAVVAESRVAAQDAAEAVVVDYEVLPSVVDPLRAVEPGAPLVWPEASNNVSAEIRYGDAKAADAAFAKAAKVVSIALVNSRVVVNPIEPRACIANVESGRVVLYGQSQMHTATRDTLAAALKEDKANTRVVVGEIGGGFGLKTGLQQEEALCAWAAKQLGRPVRWRADRAEDFLASHHGRDQRHTADLALDKDGKFLALRVRSIGNAGAVPNFAAQMIPMLMTPKVTTSVYHVPVVDYHVRSVLTNTMSLGAYRGAGRPEGNYLMERIIEKAARELGIDSLELRRRNFITPAQLPYKTHLDEWYDSGDFAKMLAGAVKASDWDGFAARKAESAQRGKLRGRGLACYLEWTGGTLQETVDIRVGGDGGVTVFSGTMGIGQGMETSITQLVCAQLEIDPARVKVVQGDTDLANGGGSVGSRTAFVGGSAAIAAGRRVIHEGKDLAGKALETAASDIEYRAGKFTVAGTDRSIGLFEVAARQEQKFFRVSVTEKSSSPSWPNGVTVMEVEIDPQTGAVSLVKHAAVDDVGRIINPMIVEGQVHGGATQGAGQALMEQAVYDTDSGQLLTGSYMDYAMPRANDMPMFNAHFDESIPAKTNLLGVKGVGELGTIGATPAVMNAVVDALSGYGVAEFDMPATAEKVWRVTRGVMNS